MDALSSGGLHQTGKDAVGFQSAFRSGSEAYLAEDHQRSERLFRVIVGGRGKKGGTSYILFVKRKKQETIKSLKTMS
jgi:hypothetical protein